MTTATIQPAAWRVSMGTTEDHNHWHYCRKKPKVIDDGEIWEPLYSASTLESLQRENEELRQDRDRTARNRDMYKGQVERQADSLSWYRSGSFAHAINEHLSSAGISVNGDIIHDCIQRSALSAQVQDVAEGWSVISNHGSVLIYCLKQNGWRKGEPVMVNDVTIRIENAAGSNHDLTDIADAIIRSLPAAPAKQEVGHD